MNIEHISVISILVIEVLDMIVVLKVKDAVGESGGFLSRDLREPRLRQPSPPPYTPKYISLSNFLIVHYCLVAGPHFSNVQAMGQWVHFLWRGS